MAYQVTQIVRRCEDANESFLLGCQITQTLPDYPLLWFKNIFPRIFPDLSQCSLIQVPDAVYHLMRHTELKSCDLSGNAITKISPKFAVKFNLITGKIAALRQWKKSNKFSF